MRSRRRGRPPESAGVRTCPHRWRHRSAGAGRPVAGRSGTARSAPAPAWPWVPGALRAASDRSARPDRWGRCRTARATGRRAGPSRATRGGRSRRRPATEPGIATVARPKRDRRGPAGMPPAPRPRVATARRRSADPGRRALPARRPLGSQGLMRRRERPLGRHAQVERKGWVESQGQVESQGRAERTEQTGSRM